MQRQKAGSTFPISMTPWKTGWSMKAWKLLKSQTTWWSRLETSVPQMLSIGFGFTKSHLRLS
jgi:hypothetical protein